MRQEIDNFLDVAGIGVEPNSPEVIFQRATGGNYWAFYPEEDALEELCELANGGYSPAICALGIAHLNGAYGLPVSVEKATSLFLLSAEIEKILSGLYDAVTPVQKSWLITRIVSLLGHFHVPDIPQQAADVHVHDWIEALKEYPQWVIEEVCTTWLRNNNRKPTIFDIIKECDLQIEGINHFIQHAGLFLLDQDGILFTVGGYSSEKKQF